MGGIRQGKYNAGGDIIRYAVIETDADLAELQRSQEGKAYEVTTWQRIESGKAEVVAYQVPGLALGAFLQEHEGCEFGTMIGIREVPAS